MPARKHARKAVVARLPRRVREVLFSGTSRRCSVCGSGLRQFISIGSRRDAVCPMCGSYERHRLTWLFLSERTDLFDGRPKRLLHIAPERSLGGRLREIPQLDYVSADLEDPRAMLQLDVTNIPLPDRSFDVILCSHVLEHVVDDASAMRELARVLRSDGWAVLEVPPFRGAVTYEDSTITAPKDRQAAFGQSDHVRIVGEDYPDRIRTHGWSVERLTAREIAADRSLTELGLRETEEILLCRPSRTPSE
jgi:SAM-dependent methyltransferase